MITSVDQVEGSFLAVKILVDREGFDEVVAKFIFEPVSYGLDNIILRFVRQLTPSATGPPQFPER